MAAPQFFQQDGAFYQGMKVAYDTNFAQLFNGTPPALIAASGAIPITPTTGPIGGNFVITKAGIAVLTLAAPKAGAQNWQNIGGFLKNNGGQDGTILVITSGTLYAHTLTATGLLGTGTANVNEATFAAYAGAGVVLMAYGGLWLVLSSTGITFS
jgi:hypothetical protein